jgi:hypothetical protein
VSVECSASVSPGVNPTEPVSSVKTEKSAITPKSENRTEAEKKLQQIEKARKERTIK